MQGSLELWLVRHGETTYSESRLLAGWTDCPLTERGREQAKALSPVLGENRFHAVWSSDLARAVTTARLAWGEPKIDARLRELNFGPLEGRSYDDVDEEFAHVFDPVQSLGTFALQPLLVLGGLDQPLGD